MCQGVRGFLTTCQNFVVIELHKVKLFMPNASHVFVLICPLNVKLICKTINLSLLGITCALLQSYFVHGKSKIVVHKTIINDVAKKF